MGKLLKYYTPLVIIFLFGVLGFWLFSYDKMFQVLIAFAMTVGYVIWGTLHHTSQKDIATEVLIEYFIIAIIGFTLLLTIIFRS